jgi:hypothetical protein
VPALRVVPEIGMRIPIRNQKGWNRELTRAIRVSRDGIHGPDGVVGAHADPVGDGAVLALLLRQLLLDPEGLVRWLRGDQTEKNRVSERVEA